MPEEPNTQVADPVATPDIPESLSKFKNEEGTLDYAKLGKSYVELEKAFTKKNQTPEPDPNALTIPDEVPLGDEDGIEQIIERAGFTREDLAKQIVENEGKLTDDQYAKFKEMGWGRRVVDQVIGQQVQTEQAAFAKAEEAMSAVHDKAVEMAGGEQQLRNLLLWGKTSLTEAEQAKYDADVANPATAAQAFEWLFLKHKAAVAGGSAESLLKGDGSSTGPATAYSTQAEFMEGSQLAKTSPEARKRHADRAAASPAVQQLPFN